MDITQHDCSTCKHGNMNWCNLSRAECGNDFKSYEFKVQTPLLCPISNRVCHPSCPWWSNDANKCAMLVIAESQRKAVRTK